MTVAEKIETKADAIDVWLHIIDALYNDVEAWAREWFLTSKWTPTEGWDIRRSRKEVVDEYPHVEYEVPVLEINSRPSVPLKGRDVRLVLEPILYNAAIGLGRVDFYVWPAMYRVRLLHDADQDEWKVKTDSGIFWPLPWNNVTFAQIAEGLLDT